MDLNFDGLMIESHRDPDAAWSDAAQQLTPAKPAYPDPAARAPFQRSQR